MNILIVEDVTKVAQRIRRLVEQHISNETNNIIVVYTIEKAEEVLQKSTPDLIFLDLNLNGRHGFDLLKLVPPENSCVIVVTANEHEAAKAYDIGIFDFITKPITTHRFQKAVRRFNQFRETKKEQPNYLPVKSFGEMILIELSQIIFIKAAGHYSEVYTSQNHFHLYSEHLEKLTESLPSHFMRIHRSYTVNLDKLLKINIFSGGKYQANLVENIIVPINKTSYQLLSSHKI